MTRQFVDTATDGTVFNTNNLLDTLSSNNIGILMPGVVIDHVQMTYAGGCAQWRIIDSVSQKIARRGWATKLNYTCASEAAIVPYKVKPTDLLQVFPKAVNATSNDSEVMAWIQTSGGTESYSVTTTSDNSATEMLNSITGQSLGTGLFGTTLQHIAVQAEDGALINYIDIQDQTGSTVWYSYGTVRLPTAGGKSPQTNLTIPVGITIGKGWTIRVAATSA